MKRKLEKYVFSRLEISILKEVADGNHSLPQIKKSLSIKSSHLSKNLKKLLQKRIIIFRKKADRSKKYVYFDSLKHASLLEELLTAFSHMKWEDILSGLGIEVLFQVLDYPESSFENLSRVTFWRYNKDFTALGIITFGEKGYRINPRFSILENFLVEYQKFLLKNIVGSLSERAIILWERDFECLAQAPKNPIAYQDDFLKTATSRLNDFGLQIFSDFDIFFYSKKKKSIRVEDVVLHTLMVEKDNVRYATYSLLLLKKEFTKINREYLLKEAQRLDLGLQVNAMLLFLETNGAYGGMTLPTWEEFVSKARQYGVLTSE